jgi:hypothetical protein
MVIETSAFRVSFLVDGNQYIIGLGDLHFGSFASSSSILLLI